MVAGLVSNLVFMLLFNNGIYTCKYNSPHYSPHFYLLSS